MHEILKWLVIQPLVLYIGESSNWSCVSIYVFIQTHISLTTSRNFLILGMIMVYDVGLMPVVSKF